MTDATRTAADDRQDLETALHDLRRAQAEILQVHKLTAIGELAAGIAHEINTPMQYVSDNTFFLQRALTQIIGAVRQSLQVVSDKAANEAVAAELKQIFRDVRFDFISSEALKALEQSLEGIRRVTTIVGAMKDFSHPSRGEMHPVDLHEAIRSTVVVARNVWKYVAVVQTDFGVDVPHVTCLRDELSQVVLNLIVNAAHAISDATADGTKGQGTITISTRAVGDCVEIRVADTGTGIPAAVRGRIFEPFFTTKPVGKGTGQGLAIAYAVVKEKHQGLIWFDTEEGKGTTFFIRLPVEPRGAAHAHSVRGR